MGRPSPPHLHRSGRSRLAPDCWRHTEPLPPPAAPCPQELHYLWTAPLEAGAILGLLAYLTGTAMLPGLGVILLVLPLQYFFGYKIIKIKLAWAKHAAIRSGILQVGCMLRWEGKRGRRRWAALRMASRSEASPEHHLNARERPCTQRRRLFRCL